MSAAVKMTRMDHTAAELRVLAAKSRDSAQSRRLLAIAMVLEGGSREDAARQAGMDRQTLRDWVHRYNETCNTEMMNLHLAEISTQLAAGACPVLICDRAGWHQAGKKLCLPDNIVLLPLPPYSPELNPMEKVWDYLRQNKLCATVWNSYDEIIEACKTAWNWLIADPDRIRSIGSRTWATVNV
jgi:hypothetical protein